MIRQFQGREGRVRKDLDRILEQTGQLKTGIDRICDQLVENLQLDLHKYIRAAFAPLETLTTTLRGRLGGSVHVPVHNINEGLKSLTEIVEGLRCPSASKT